MDDKWITTEITNRYSSKGYYAIVFVFSFDDAGQEISATPNVYMYADSMRCERRKVYERFDPHGVEWVPHPFQGKTWDQA